jgi:hypothetical protein
MKSLAQLDMNKIIQEKHMVEGIVPVIIEDSTHEHWMDIHPSKNNSIHTFELSYGTFIDHEHLSLLVSEQKIIKTWPTQNWSILMIDQTERFVIFESDSSYHMSILDLESGEWKEDSEGHQLYFSDDGEAIIDNFHSIIHPFPEE